MRQNLKTQIVTKLKKNQTVTKLKKKINRGKTQTVIKLKKTNCDKTWKMKFWPNSNCAKLTKKNCDNSKTQIVIVIKMTLVTEVFILTSFSKKIP